MTGPPPASWSPCPLSRALVAVLAALFVALALPATPVAAASMAKVVVIVGPVGDHNAHYKADANDIVTEAKRYTSNVVKLFTPNATWSKVKAAAQGANILVYLGHGNGWPSIYAPFQTQTKNGLGLDPSSGADGNKVVYYGEDYLRSSIRLAPNSVVLLYHLCYASGNTEPGLSQGTLRRPGSGLTTTAPASSARAPGRSSRRVIPRTQPPTTSGSCSRPAARWTRSFALRPRGTTTWPAHTRPADAGPAVPARLRHRARRRALPVELVGDLSLSATKVPGRERPGHRRQPAGSCCRCRRGACTDGVPCSTPPRPPSIRSRRRRGHPADDEKLRLAEELAPAVDGTRIFSRGEAIFESADHGLRAGSGVRAAGQRPPPSCDPSTRAPRGCPPTTTTCADSVSRPGLREHGGKTKS